MIDHGQPRRLKRRGESPQSQPVMPVILGGLIHLFTAQSKTASN